MKSNEEHLKVAKENAKENEKYLSKFKSRKLKRADYVFQEVHDEVFEHTDCLTCGNCCKTTSPIFRDKDIENLSKHFKIKPIQFIEKYLHRDRDYDWVLSTKPCPFLADDNYCTVYDHRPLACNEYPHTNRKNMYQIMDLTFENSLICPAVSEIVEKLKVKVPNPNKLK